jgi:glycosyltransferase involved in cell wall biosynthesis
MINIAIIHPSLNYMGGAENVSISIMQVLKQKGYNITLLTIDETNWKNIADRFGKKIKPDKELYLYPRGSEVRLNIPRVSKIGLRFLHFLREELENYGLVVNTYGDFDLLNAFADVTYSGFPFSMSFVFPDIAPYPLKHRATQGAYYVVNSAMKCLVIKRNPLVLANSTFTERWLRRFYRSKILIDVVHPPCDTEHFSVDLNSVKKENAAVIISRFSRGKRLELVPEIAKRAKKWDFFMIGSVSDTSKEILELLKEKIKSYDLEDRVMVLPNLPRYKIKNIMAGAKIYLHLMRNEPFGMSIIEAMSSGCVPIVHMSGGAWPDILEKKQGYYGYVYDDYKEVIEYFNKIEKEDVYEILSERAQKRADYFDEKKFQMKFNGVINKVINKKV